MENGLKYQVFIVFCTNGCI